MRRRLALLALSALLAGQLAIDGVPVAAATSSLSDAQQELVDATEEEAAAFKALNAIRAEEKQLDAKVTQLDGELRAAQARVDAAQAEADEATAQHLVVVQQLEVAKAAVASARETLRDYAIRAYITSGSGAPSRQLETLSRSGSQHEVQTARVLDDVVAARQDEVVDDYRLAEDDAARLEVESSRLQAVSIAKLAEARDEAVEVEAARDRQLAAKAELDAKLAELDAKLDEIQARKAKWEAEVAAQQRTSDSISSLLRSRQATQTLGVGVSLRDPLDDMRVTSSFGNRVHPIYGETRFHAGIDMGASTGTSVLSSADGTVVFAGNSSGYGNYTVIDHGGQLATAYAHQASIGVSVGDSVTRGQRIGTVGSTGASTGPHLHFEVRILGSPVDPCGYLSAC